MRRPGKLAAAMAGLALGALLAGCGEEFPTLTQDEYDLIVDYSAGVLSKYTMGNGDKLTRVAPLPAEEPEESSAISASAAPSTEADTEGAAAEAAASVEETAEEETQSAAETAHSTEGAATEEADAPEEGTALPAGASSSEEGADEAESAGTSGSAVAIGSSGDLLQQLKSGIAIDLNGYYVLNSYPDHAAGSGTALTADEGSKLLILSFLLANGTESAIDIDFLRDNVTYTLMLNDQPVSKNLVTLLDTDMSTYVGRLDAGERTGAVLCFQIRDEQAREIKTLGLRVNVRGEEQLLQIE